MSSTNNYHFLDETEHLPFMSCWTVAISSWHLRCSTAMSFSAVHCAIVTALRASSSSSCSSRTWARSTSSSTSTALVWSDCSLNSSVKNKTKGFHFPMPDATCILEKRAEYSGLWSCCYSYMPSISNFHDL